MLGEICPWEEAKRAEAGSLTRDVSVRLHRIAADEDKAWAMMTQQQQAIT